MRRARSMGRAPDDELPIRPPKIAAGPVFPSPGCASSPVRDGVPRGHSAMTWLRFFAPGRPRKAAPRVQALEDRFAPALVVTNTLDAGPGSLRQAILDANAAPTPQTIQFNIAAG